MTIDEIPDNSGLPDDDLGKSLYDGLVASVVETLHMAKAPEWDDLCRGARAPFVAVAKFVIDINIETQLAIAGAYQETCGKEWKDATANEQDQFKKALSEHLKSVEIADNALLDETGGGNEKP